MAVAHVGERVFVAELLIAGLEVDAREVRFAESEVLVEVAVVDVDVGAAERVDDSDEAREVDVDDRRSGLSPGKTSLLIVSAASSMPPRVPPSWLPIVYAALIFSWL